MYLRLAGIAMIIMAAALIGYLFSRDYMERIRQLEKIERMLIYLKGEISYSNNSVKEALDNVANMLDGVVGEFAMYAKEKLNVSDESLSYVWDLSVDNILGKKSALKGIDIRELKDFGKGLGITNRETQLDNIEKYKGIIEITMNELKEEKNEKCRLYRMIGITFGVFLGIVLI